MIDALPLAQSLLRCRSVTPADDGAQAVLAAFLERVGFTVTKLKFGGIENFYAERGSGGPHLCFAGHTDVVPVGLAAWRHEPFAGTVDHGLLYGRGACDMKGAIAAFATAAVEVPSRGTLSFLITGDEEGVAVDGTAKVLEWMRAEGKTPDFCIVGEPTSKSRLGDVVKIGRRGSLNAEITVTGRQGHVAYPQLADNPIHRLLRGLSALAEHRLDEGNEWFEPSSLQITTVDVGNTATNVIPAAATASLNIRFNNLHSEASLTAWLRQEAAKFMPDAEMRIACSGEAFLTQPGFGTEALAKAIQDVTGVTPAHNTGGGTSDARFIARCFPVAEFGLVGASMHQADEAVPVAELQQLVLIYRRMIESFLR